MIRVFENKDLTDVMQIWLDTNIKAHFFIPKEYWTDNFEIVKSALPRSEVYVYEDESTSQIHGFIGLSNNFVEGIFVKEGSQSKGIGKQLLEYVKSNRSHISLCVYQKNTRAIQFYQREQFIILSERIDENTNQNEYIMVWNK